MVVRSEPHLENSSPRWARTACTVNATPARRLPSGTRAHRAQRGWSVMRRKSACIPKPMTDEEWLRVRPQGQCEAPCCTARGKQRIPKVVDLDRRGLPGLREMLCLCTFHYRALADRIVIACWGEPPANGVWRAGTPRR